MTEPNDGEGAAPGSITQVERDPPAAPDARQPTTTGPVVAPPPSLTIRQFDEYFGPIPSPEMLEEYDHVQPGLAKALVDGFMREGAHRRKGDRIQWDLMRTLAAAQVQDGHRGMNYALVIALAFVALAAYVAHLGSPWAAATIVGADLVGLVVVFVAGRRYDAKEAAAEKQLPASAPAKGSSPDER